MSTNFTFTKAKKNNLVSDPLPGVQQLDKLEVVGSIRRLLVPVGLDLSFDFCCRFSGVEQLVQGEPLSQVFEGERMALF